MVKGKPSKFSARSKRKTVHKAPNSMKSASQVKAEYSLNVFNRTILSAIYESPYLKEVKLKSAPNLRQQDKLNRLAFARENMKRKWNEENIILKIIYS